MLIIYCVCITAGEDNDSSRREGDRVSKGAAGEKRQGVLTQVRKWRELNKVVGCRLRGE